MATSSASRRSASPLTASLVPAQTQTMAVNGIDVIVTRNGTQQYDLRFVVQNGRLLLDDIVFEITCAPSGVSVYALSLQPGSAQQPVLPGPIPTCPASPAP